jgi:glucose/arabinose dehydrogenase/cytochrome c2
MQSFFKPFSLIVTSVVLLVLGGVFFAQCTGSKSIVTENDFESLDLGPFIEKDFPYVPTSMDASNLGASFPSYNVSARTLALKLQDSSYVCFDTDMLRWTVAWTGDFLPMYLMPQVSYKDYYNKGNKIAVIAGQPKLATGLYPGWSTGKPVFEDPREAEKVENIPVWGPIAPALGRWNGVYVYGNQAVLSYRVGKTEIREIASASRFSRQTAFQRDFRIGAGADDLFFTAAEVVGGKEVKITDKMSCVHHGAKGDSVTAVAVLNPGVATNVIEQRYLSVAVPASGAERQISVLVWMGPVSELPAFEAQVAATRQIKFPSFEKGGDSQWKGHVYTEGKLSADSEDYVVDQVTLPLPNPWKRNVRVADIAFWPDGKAAVVTFSGDVWLVEGLDKDLKKVKWSRFATGIHEPLSIEIRKNDVYVFGREGIVKLVDLNKDGMVDYYENFSNVAQQSPESREWAADLVLGPDDCFYIAKGGALSNGPGPTPVAGKGFRTGSIHSGSILKISQDGQQVEVIASGLRGPYIGMHPKTGVLTSSDQQGNFVPSTPLFLVNKGDFYGVPPTMHRKDSPEPTPPLTWIPHSVDRSALGQAWITSDKMGPLNENLIHFSFGRPGLLRVLFDTTSQAIQGGVSFIKGNYTAPTSKGAVSPKDGQLYITGFNLWGSSAKGIAALQRLRYTGLPSYRPNRFEVGTEGIVLQFDSELSEEAAGNPKNFRIKRWNYLRTEEYGSGHYKLDGTPGQEILPVLATSLSADKKAVFLLVPDVKEAMQMEVLYDLAAADGRAMQDGFWFTPKSVEKLNLAPYRLGSVDLTLLSNREAIAKASEAVAEVVSVEHGRALFEKMACVGCHSTGEQVDGMYGPPLKGIIGKTREFTDGTSTKANDKYLKESILDPPVKHVKGYSGEMPSYVGIFSDSDLESVVLYIKSL